MFGGITVFLLFQISVPYLKFTVVIPLCVADRGYCPGVKYYNMSLLFPKVRACQWNYGEKYDDPCDQSEEAPQRLNTGQRMKKWTAEQWK